MSPFLAQRLVDIAAAYAAIGVVFGALFLAIGIRRIDPAAAAGSRGFRFIVAPGVVALWPIMAWRWWRGGPIEAHDAHPSPPHAASSPAEDRRPR
ncbi:MAG: hypothetical protein ABI780_15195 [Ardenticatenales bacterium]